MTVEEDATRAASGARRRKDTRLERPGDARCGEPGPGVRRRLLGTHEVRRPTFVSVSLPHCGSPWAAAGTRRCSSARLRAGALADGEARGDQTGSIGSGGA
jgi:hypothetical protein